MKKSRLFFLLPIFLVGLAALFCCLEISSLERAEIINETMAVTPTVPGTDAILADLLLDHVFAGMSHSTRKTFYSNLIKTRPSASIAFLPEYELNFIGDYSSNNELPSYLAIFLSDTTPPRAGPFAG